MIELYELRQFTAFAEASTLSEAADNLHLSQPALSRNMKKLEEDLGIPLFERMKNKLVLNENGTYVFELARKLLDDADSLASKARDYDCRNRTIALGVCAPAPVWRRAPLPRKPQPGEGLPVAGQKDRPQGRLDPANPALRKSFITISSK